MGDSYRQIHLSEDVLLETFKFLLKNDLRNCQKVALKWKVLVQRNKHMLCKITQMKKTFLATLKCVNRDRTDNEYAEFCQAIFNLLQCSREIKLSTLVREFSLVDHQFYLFTKIHSIAYSFQLNKEIKSRELRTSALVIFFLCSKKIRHRLNENFKIIHDVKLKIIHEEVMPNLLIGAMNCVSTKKDSLVKPEIEAVVSIVCSYIRLSLIYEEDEDNLNAVADTLEAIPFNMDDYYFKMLICATTELCMKTELYCASKAILNSVESFAIGSNSRMAKIQTLRNTLASS